ncbi:slit 2 protein-like protein [Leptotrombidium deliense]|uniref:Slit 2 protein-like protein n=1 Tax=Leptotrombidium deliense TaxID=299467 RepID=A0A443ST27_9ACAR|nr:slit 2 protein-like protein [Leptotrombidium deliense]
MQPTTYLTCLFTAFCYRGIQQKDNLCPIGCDCIGGKTDRSFYCHSTSVIFLTTLNHFRTLQLIDVRSISKLPSKATLLLNCDYLMIDKAGNVKQPKPEHINVFPSFVTITNSDLKNVEKYFRIDYSLTREIHFENISDLEEIWLTQKFENLISLTVLNSPIESITFGTFYWLPNLESLVLRHTKINGTLSSEWFRRKMINLKYLDLSYNKLTTIDKYVFTKLPSLKILKLNNNLLTGINWETMKPIWHNLQEFWLTGNVNLKCDYFCWIFDHFPHPSVFDSTDCSFSIIPPKETNFFNFTSNTHNLKCKQLIV